MKTKNTVFLLIIAVAVVAAIVYQKSKSESGMTQAAIPEQTIPSITSSTLERIIVEDPEHDPVTLTLVDGQWYTNVEQKYEADENAVNAAMRSVEEPINATVVSSNPDSFESYSVSDDTGTKVSFYNKGESDPALALIVGNDGPAAFTTYVRVAGEDEVLNARASLSMTFKRSGGWRKHQIFQFPGPNAIRVSAEGTSSTFTAKKTGETWNFEEPLSGEAQAVRMTSLANMLASLRANEFIDLTTTQTLESMGLEPPRQKLVLTYEDKTTSPSTEKTATLLIGNMVDPDGDWYAKREDKNDVFTIGQHVAAALMPDPESIKVAPPEQPAPDPDTTDADAVTTDVQQPEPASEVQETTPADDASTGAETLTEPAPAVEPEAAAPAIQETTPDAGETTPSIDNQATTST